MNDMRKLMEAVEALNGASLDTSVFQKIEKKLSKIPGLKIKIAGKKMVVQNKDKSLYIGAEAYREPGDKETWINFDDSWMSGNDPADQFYWHALSSVVRYYEELYFFEPDLFDTSSEESKEENAEYWADAGITREQCYKILKYLDPKRELSHEPPMGKKLKPW